MSYATVEDFLRHCRASETVELTTEDPDAILAEGDRIQFQLENAAGEINTYLASRYSISVATTAKPPFLRWANCAIARQYLDWAINREKVELDADLARKRLADIRSGTGVLVGADGLPVSELTAAIGLTVPMMSLDCI